MYVEGSGGRSNLNFTYTFMCTSKLNMYINEQNMGLLDLQRLEFDAQS